MSAEFFSARPRVNSNMFTVLGSQAIRYSPLASKHLVEKEFFYLPL